MADENRKDEINTEVPEVAEEVVEAEVPVEETQAQEENPAQEEVKKNPNPYEFRDVEAAVKVLMKPNIAKVLSKYKVDINDMLPAIYEKNPVLENETIEQYALRCIDTGFALGLQENYKNIVVEKHKDEARQTYNMGEEPAARHRQEEDKSISPEMMEVYKKAADAQKRIVAAVLALPFVMLKILTEDNNILMTLNDNTVEMTELSEEEAKDLADYMQKAKIYLNKAMALDKVDTQTIAKDTDEQALEQINNDIEAVYDADIQGQREASLKHPFTKKEFEDAFLSKAEDPKMKEMFEELGIKDPKAVVDSIYNNVKSEPNEELDAYVMRTMEDELRRRSIDAATKKAKDGQNELMNHTRPAKYRSEQKKHELPEPGKDKEKENDIFKAIKQILTLPYEIFKTIMIGKLSEEQKKDENLVNLKEKIAVLSPEIRKELYDYQERISNAMKDVFGKDYQDRKKSTELNIPSVTEPQVNHQEQPQVNPTEQPQVNPTEKPEEFTKSAPTGVNAIYAERNIAGRRKILGANQRTEAYDVEQFNKLLADFDKLDLSDTIAAMAWVSDFAIITKNTGLSIPEDIKAKMVEKFNDNKCYTDPKFELEEFEKEANGGRRMHVLTEAARAIAGDYEISTKTMLHAESVIAREDISLAHINLILGPDACSKDTAQVGTTELTTNDALHQEEINKILADFDSLDFNNKQSVLKWMQEYGAAASFMNQRPNISPEQKSKMAAKFKEFKICTLEGAENLYSSDLEKKDETTDRFLTAGAYDILSKGKIRADVLENIGGLLPEESRAIHAYELDPSKNAALRTLTEKVISAPNIAQEMVGQEIVHEIGVAKGVISKAFENRDNQIQPEEPSLEQ